MVAEWTQWRLKCRMRPLIGLGSSQGRLPKSEHCFFWEVFPDPPTSTQVGHFHLCAFSTSYIPLVLHLFHYLLAALYLYNWLLQRPGVCWGPRPCFIHLSIPNVIQCQVHIFLLSKWTINSLNSSEDNNPIKYMIFL